MMDLRCNDGLRTAVLAACITCFACTSAADGGTAPRSDAALDDAGRNAIDAAASKTDAAIARDAGADGSATDAAPDAATCDVSQCSAPDAALPFLDRLGTIDACCNDQTGLSRLLLEVIPGLHSVVRSFVQTLAVQPR